MSTPTAEQLQVHVDAIRDAFKMTAIEIMRRMVKGELLTRFGAMTGTVYYVLEWNEAPPKALRVVEDLLRVGMPSASSRLVTLGSIMDVTSRTPLLFTLLMGRHSDVML